MDCHLYKSSKSIRRTTSALYKRTIWYKVTRQVPHTMQSEVWRSRMTNMDVNVMLAQSCGVMGVCVMKFKLRLQWWVFVASTGKDLEEKYSWALHWDALLPRPV